MKLSDNELWEHIKALEGKTVCTKTYKKPNRIIRVTENRVEIEGRTSSVSFKGKAGIFENYHTLIKDGYLIGKSGEDRMMKANLYGWYVIMAILHEVLPDETQEIRGGIREV